MQRYSFGASIKATRRAIDNTIARAKSFRDEEAGSMLVFGLMIFILMLWSLGLAIDAMRVENKRTLIQNTLDRAVLAAADLDSDQNAQVVVEDYFAKAGISQYLDAVRVDTKSAASRLSFRSVSADATAPVPTMFLDMLGYDTLYAIGSSAAQEGIGQLEISLIVDVSGSMGWASSTGKSKLWELQEAAKEFSWSMLCNPTDPINANGNCSVEPGTVSISLIPYAEQVVVGEALLNAINDPTLSRYTVTDEHISSNCANFDAVDYQTRLLSDDTLLERTGHFDPWGSGTFASDSRRTCRTDDWRTIRPYVGHHSNLNYLINNLRAGGNTSIDIGMKWGVSLLDPELRDVINSMATTDRVGGAGATEPDFSGRPYDYGTDTSMKVVVLMTDGVNTNQHWLYNEYRSGMSPIWRYVDQSNKDSYSIYNASTDKYYYTGDGNWYTEPYGKGATVETTTVSCSRRWWRGRRCTYTTTTSTITSGSVAVQMSYPEVWKTFTTDWYQSWSWLGDPVSYHANAEKNARLHNICSVAKDNNIIVYTIGFETPTSGEQLLVDCASTPGHFFHAEGANLAEIFNVIATSINKLRLTQ